MAKKYVVEVTYKTIEEHHVTADNEMFARQHAVVQAQLGADGYFELIDTQVREVDYDR